MKKLILGILLVLVSPFALGQALTCPAPTFQAPAGANITLTWNAPTANVDGSALSGPITYTLYNAATNPPVPIVTGLTTTSSVRSNLSPGTPCYAVQAIVNGVASSFSNTASVMVLPPVPNPPKGLTCTLVIPTGGTPVTGNCTTSP